MYFSYLKTVLKHRWYVLIACFKLKLFWQGLIHDNSKLSPFEFIRYARKFNGPKNDLYTSLDNDRLERAETSFQFAWNHHIHNNKHHWQYWCIINDKDLTNVVSVKSLDIPIEYIDEIICDWWAAGKSYKGPGLVPWYNLNKHKMIFSERTKKIISTRIIMIDKILNKRR